MLSIPCELDEIILQPAIPQPSRTQGRLIVELFQHQFQHHSSASASFTSEKMKL